MELPEDVHSWLHSVFRACNERISTKLCNNPNLPEGSLDLTWIEHLSQYSTPVTLNSNWIVKIETHYLGGLRHIYNWEVADIGLLVFFRRGGTLETSKVALLQSKRLYPSNNRVREEHVIDYEIGFARLADPEDLSRSISVQVEFRFTDACRYGALSAGARQVGAIAEYEKKNKLHVYYQFYNPWQVPFTQRVPVSEFKTPDGELTLGTRIIPAKLVHRVLAEHQKNYKPRLSDLAGLINKRHEFGWSLEHFICDRLLKCREGDKFTSLSDNRVQQLFYRRSGPIAAAIAVTIEAPA